MSDYTWGSTAAQRNIQVAEKRRAAYQERLGDWHQQLEMIYGDMDNWRAQIAAIKAEFPKEAE